MTMGRKWVCPVFLWQPRAAALARMNVKDLQTRHTTIETKARKCKVNRNTIEREKRNKQSNFESKMAHM